MYVGGSTDELQIVNVYEKSKRRNPTFHEKLINPLGLECTQLF